MGRGFNKITLFLARITYVKRHRMRSQIEP